MSPSYYFSMLPAHQIQSLYDQFKEKLVRFDEKAVASTGLSPDKTTLKVRTLLLPCLLYSASMNNANLIIKLNYTGIQQIDSAKNNGALKLFFAVSGKNEHIQININIKIIEMKLLKAQKNAVYQLSAKYINKPPDDYIVILGKLIEAQSFSPKKEKVEETVKLPELKQNMQRLKKINTKIFCKGKEENCVLETVSISGARVIIEGARSEYLHNRVMLKMKTKRIKGAGEVLGNVTRYSNMQTINGLVTILSISFDERDIPDSYKIWLEELIKIFVL